MFCKGCGKEVSENAVVCPHCNTILDEKEFNRRLAIEKYANNNNSFRDYDTPKTGIGVLMGLFLGLIGLIIGICIYPENTVARTTFIKSWLITFFVALGVGVLLFIIIYLIAFNATVAYYPRYY